jgi:hypothetical protein
MFMVVPKQFQSEYGSHIVFLGKEKIEVICMQYFSQWMMQLIKEWLNTSSTLSKVGIHHIRTTFLNATAILCIKSLFVQHLSFNIWRCTVKIFFDKEARVSGADPETLLTGRGGSVMVFWSPPMVFWIPYPWYIYPPTDGILNPVPTVVRTLTNGISNPIHIVFRTPYTWYIGPLYIVFWTHFSWYIQPLPMVFRTRYPW